MSFHRGKLVEAKVILLPEGIYKIIKMKLYYALYYLVVAKIESTKYWSLDYCCILNEMS